MKTASIYLHMPFCKSKCVYCNFHSYTDKGGLIAPYVEAMKSELLSYAEKFSETEIISVYFGGGTPCIVPSKLIGELFETITKNFRVAENAEIAIETNPAAASQKHINSFKTIGVNRVSVGLQSANDTILKVLKRPHSTRDFVNTIKMLRKAGFDNINADIMLGLPAQTMEDVKKTLKLLLALNIPHISAYGLKLEKGTALANAVKSGAITLPDEDAAVDMYDYVYRECEANKIYRYEVSNFAKPDYESEHNLNYWDWGRYLGVGVNAHSFIHDTRSSNIRDIDKYISHIKEGKSVVSSRHKLTLKEAEMEYIMLALRKEEGIKVAKFNEIFFTDIIKRMGPKLSALERIGAIVFDRDYINVKADRMYILNSIILEFIN